MQATHVLIQQADGQQTVGGLDITMPFANDAIAGLGNIPDGTAFSAYPLVPGVDVAHDTTDLAISDGLSASTLVKTGTFSIVSTATGVATDAITYTNAFPNATNVVLLTLTGLGGAVLNGGSYAPTADVSNTGFTASVSITTAGTTNVTGTWVAFGH